MNKQAKHVTRREALLAGAGMMGTLAALSSGFSPVFAAPARARTRAATSAAAHDDQEWQQVAAVFGTQGMVENGVLSIEIPRTDIHATVFGVPANPDAIFEHEFTFQHTDNGAIVKYEFVVLDEEANPVLDALFARRDQLPPGITILNALHNHWLEIKPDVKYMHGTARNDALTIARALRAALDRTATPLGMSSGSGNTGLPNEQIAQIIGGTPTVDDHVLKVDVDRKEKIEELDVELKPEMQVHHETIFQPIGGGRAAMYTEYILLPEEVHAVAREMREHDQNVTAVHNHELVIHPRFYWFHSFGTGDPLDLARAARAALKHTNSVFVSSQ
jgi:hypothetical protein